MSRTESKLDDVDKTVMRMLIRSWSIECNLLMYIKSCLVSLLSCQTSMMMFWEEFSVNVDNQYIVNVITTTKVSNKTDKMTMTVSLIKKSDKLINKQWCHRSWCDKWQIFNHHHHWSMKQLMLPYCYEQSHKIKKEWYFKLWNQPAI